MSSDHALHVQCVWRIDGPQGIVTGLHDLWEPAEDSSDIDWDAWDYERNGNLQDKLMYEFLGGYDAQICAPVNETDGLVVEAVASDLYGGATLTLSGGFRLVLFPACSRGEDWRLFQPALDGPHFVVAGGRPESEE